MEQHGAAGKCGKAVVPRNLYGQCLRVLEESMVQKVREIRKGQ